MIRHPLPPLIYINTQEKLNELAKTLASESLLAFDTESNSLYSYQEQVCLIQVSTRTADYIIDPLLVPDMQPLGPLMASASIEKIFHAAIYDIMAMKRDFAFSFANIFDTMVAARLCGLEVTGLGSILHYYAGITTDKSHQLDDWRQRPLSGESLVYAQMDTHFLPYLRDELAAMLRQKGHYEEALELFEEICWVPASAKRAYDPQAFWHLGRPNRLSKRELKILHKLFEVREEIAVAVDCPPHRILNNKALIALARKKPVRLHELDQISYIAGDVLVDFGDNILRAIQEGKKVNKLPPLPPQNRPEPVITERYAALHTWRKERANRRGVDSDVIVSKNTLWDLAHKAPRNLEDLEQIDGLGPWRMRQYGQEIIGVLEPYL